MKLTRFEKTILTLEIIWDALRDSFRSKISKTIFAVLILSSSLYVALSYKPIAQSLPSCSSLASNVTPNAGVNCLYFGLPLCRDVANPVHRVNCADFVDLPLCSDIVTSGGATANPGKNCINLCSSSAYDNPNPSASPALQRGVDFAVFNRDCLRFCDDVEAGITPNPGVNCANRKCHQVLAGVTPTDGANCNMVDCNLLTPDELNKTKFDDSTKKYCNGDIKCYNFTQSQLPYMRVRAANPTCKIHACPPLSANCGTSDILNVTNQGSGYTSVYQTYINAGFDINSNAVCSPINCRPVVRTQYRCTTNGVQVTGNDTLDIVRNNLCDTTGDGAVCSNNYCFLSTDCNLSANSTKTECSAAANVPPISGEDPFNSWFYRPKPMDKATQGNGIIRSNMRDDFCYDMNAMKDNDWGDDRDFGLWSWWFTDYLSYDTRSPGACNTSRSGNRGTNYGYLCGVRGNIFTKPHDYVAYFKGYATTDFSGPVPKHKVTVCLRFTNTMTLNACGARECGVTAGFDTFWGQTCGGDVCRELVVEESTNTGNCMMTGSGSMSGECADTIDDDYLRVRAVKYQDKICAFLDSKGQVAYNNMFMDGSETLNDGITCINDASSNGNAGCNGHNSNATPAEADKWRALLKVHYIDNNRPNNPYGYLDKSGKLYPEQECPKVTLRIPPPNLYNLASIGNSQRLFSPPLFIRSVSVMRGREDAIAPVGAEFGRTDFHYPEVKIQFGTDIHPMSLGLGYTGYEGQGNDEGYTASPSRKTVSTILNGRTYYATLFVRKEYSENGSLPIFCVYRTVSDANGLELDPIKFACIERERPYINNSFERTVNPTLPGRRAIIYPKLGNEFNNAKLVIRYLASFGANNTNNNCSGDDSCTGELELGNQIYGQQECSLNLESHKICAQREECSQLNIECVTNENNLRDAQINNLSTAQFLSIRENCNKNILPLCNAKKGIASASSATIYNPNPSNTSPNPDAYGWFNELCIVKGFESRLKNVISKKTVTGVKGKCLIDPQSPYLTDGNSSTNCDAGGFAPNCLCVEAPTDYVAATNEIVRKQTPREAGLCIDMPIPQMCPVINHNPLPNSDATDFDYVTHSLGKNTYNDTNGVHSSHQYRSQGKPDPNGILVAGHAEFPTALIGMSDIYGECRGYWTYQKNASGIIQSPTLSCLNSSGNAVWESSARNACVRYTCPDVLTTGPDVNGNYQGDYGKNEIAENKGASSGFATWSRFTKTNDFMESVGAVACIAGFKPTGSTATYANGVITGYSGGSLPTRQCNQLGQWQTPTNSCQRISCPLINPQVPSSVNDTTAWNAWYDSGGATFPSVFASRSNIRTQAESIASGTCNNNLGFFQSPGGQPPTRECNYLGNWGPVVNPCVTTCDAITSDSEASSLNNGFSLWAAVTSAVGSQGVEGTFNGCAVGYVTNPYPPKTDINGAALPTDVANDITRPAENPRRMCKLGTTTSGVSASVWANVNNGCINRCPGSDVDSRIGVGITTHQTSSGSVNLSWPSTALGQDAYVTNWNGLESLFNAQYFIQGRTNGYYLMKRHCGTNGRWDDPQAMCSANTGQIGNATYPKTGAVGYASSVIAGDNSSSETLTGDCITNYWKSNNDSGPLPQRKCVFESGNTHINKVYLTLANSTNDCVVKSCPPRAASSTAAYSFAAVSGYSPAGTQVRATCVGSRRTFYDDVEPSVSCQVDGTWSTVQNSSNCQLGCSTPEVYNGSDVCDDGAGAAMSGISVAPGRYTIQVSHLEGCGCSSSSVRSIVCDGATGTITENSDGGKNSQWGVCGSITQVRFIDNNNNFTGWINAPWAWASVRVNNPNGIVTDGFYDGSGVWKKSNDVGYSVYDDD